MEWTEQRIELLTTLSQQGLSARDIAARLGGVTRDAVIGKLYRINRPAAAKTPPDRVNIRPSRAKAAPTVQVEAPIAPTVIAPAPAPAPTPVAVIIGQASHNHDEVGSAVLTALQPHMCRWPFGDPTSNSFRFCGATADGGSYCGRHAAVAYQPKPDRSRPASTAVRFGR